MVIRGILFDLDGTLLDTIHDIAFGMNTILKAHDYPEHSEESYKSFVGDGIKMLVVRSLPESSRNEETVALLLEELKALFKERSPGSAQPFPGILSLLAECKERGLQLAILSNKIDEMTKEVVNALLPAHYFSVIAGAKEDIPHKPDPTGTIAILQELKIKPEECLFVGDTEIDIDTARRAGCIPVGVSWGFRKNQVLKEAGAGVIIDRPEDLLELLSS